MSFQLVADALKALAATSGSSKGVTRKSIKAHIGDKATVSRINVRPYLFRQITEYTRLYLLFANVLFLYTN